MNSIPRFHLAFPVHNLESAREFYVSILKCNTGRESDSWIDFDLYGHQIVAHLSPDDCSSTSTNIVDNYNIPSRHFGVILECHIAGSNPKKSENLNLNSLVKNISGSKTKACLFSEIIFFGVLDILRPKDKFFSTLILG